MVRTDAFKKWFGDWENNPKNASKVIDENGEPKIVYNGGDKDSVGFTKFNTKRKSPRNIGMKDEWREFGAFFTDDLETAKYYSMESENRNIPSLKGEVRQFFLNIKKPLIKEVKGERWYTVIPEIFHISRGVGVKNYTASDETHDGFIAKDIDEADMGAATTYHIKKSNQAKLADGSNTTFKPNSLDITLNKGGKAGAAVGESRLMNLPESSVIALNNHLIGLSLQISELIQARIIYLENMSEKDYLKLKEGSYNFKEKDSDLQSYEEWLEESKLLDKETNDASDAIQSFPTNEMGLTPDEVEKTEEYKVAKKNWNTSFKRLQEFGRKSPKEFQRRRSTEKRQAMMSKNKG